MAQCGLRRMPHSAELSKSSRGKQFVFNCSAAMRKIGCRKRSEEMPFHLGADNFSDRSTRIRSGIVLPHIIAS